MVVPKGYKKTELGIIPEDWKILKAEQLMTIGTGSRNTEHKTQNGSYPFFVRSQAIEKIDNYNYDCEAVLTAGDGVGTGKVYHYINGKFDVHQRVYVMTDFQSIDGKFFFNYFRENFYDEVCKYTAKSTVDSVRKDMIAKMLIPTPNLPEQKRIVQVLSDIDELICNLEKLIAKKKDIKQGAMQELLTGKKRLKGFDDEWVEKELQSIANIHNNLRVPISEHLRKIGYIPYYGANGIQSYIEGFTHDGEFVLIAEDGANDILNYPINYTVGKIWVNNHAHVINAIQNICDTKFLYYRLKMIDFQKVLVGGTRTKLNSSILKTIIISFPINIEEQIAIATILSDMDTEISELEKKLVKYTDIKQGMMQELLTGRIRLPELKNNTN